MMLATLANFNGLPDSCNAYDTLESRDFVQMAVIRQDILIKLLTLSTDSVTIFLAAKIGLEFGNKLYGQHL